MIHHDGRAYELAEHAAVEAARSKFQTIIDQGKGKARTVVEKIQREVPHDVLAPASQLVWTPEALSPALQMAIPEPLVLRPAPLANDLPASIEEALERTVAKVHPQVTVRVNVHALNQACQRVGIPQRYAHTLLAPDVQKWGPALLAHSLNEHFRNQPGRFLLRSYDGELRGLLSDSYRRLDSWTILEAFVGACQEIGAVPVEGYATSTKVAIKAMLTKLFEPAKGEIMAFGVLLENSDYGNGPVAVSAFMLRPWCTNYAIANQSLRQVHLGRRLTDDVAWSERTRQLDSETAASAVSDIVKDTLGEKRTTQLCEAIRKAHEESTDVDKVLEAFKKQLNLSEIEQVTRSFNSLDVENLPPGNTTWRLSNAMSWVAGQTADVERKLELMKAAGRVLGKSLEWTD